MIKTKKRIGIILAAGIGSRLNVLPQKGVIKPLAEVDDLSLLVRAIRSLEVAECVQVVIVLGYKALEIQEQIAAKYNGPIMLKFAVNDQYGLQNGISVLCARPFVDGEFVLTMADHILDDSIMSLVRSHRPPKGGATLCVDYKLDTIFDMDDATKVCSVDGYVTKIDKRLAKYNCIDTGVFIGTQGLFDSIEQVFQEKGDASLSEGIQSLADKRLMMTLDIEGAFWQDVDNYEMLIHAENMLKAAKKNPKPVHANPEPRLSHETQLL